MSVNVQLFAREERIFFLFLITIFLQFNSKGVCAPHPLATKPPGCCGRRLPGQLWTATPHQWSLWFPTALGEKRWRFITPTYATSRVLLPLDCSDTTDLHGCRCCWQLDPAGTKSFHQRELWCRGRRQQMLAC